MPHRTRLVSAPGIARLALLASLGAALAATGCGNTDTVTVGPAATFVADTFSGTLTLNGAQTFLFTVSTTGSISAALTTLTSSAPGATVVPIGIALGTWNGAACQVVLASDAVLQSSSVPGQVNATGTFCLRVYDAIGTVTPPESYVITVTHP